MSYSNAPRSFFTQVVVYIATFCFASGCTSLHPIPSNGPPTQDRFAVGERVEITKTDGSVVAFKIKSIDAEGIGGKDAYVAYAEIREVSKRRAAPGKSILAGFGILVGLIVIVAATIDEEDIFGPLP